MRLSARLQIQWFFCMLFICKSNSCPWLAVENNDIMNLRPRGPWGPTGPRTKTNQSQPNIMETVAFSALRKLPFNPDSCIFLTAGTFKKALSAFTFFPTGNFDFSCKLILGVSFEILEMSVGAFAFRRWSQETVFVRLTVININLHSRYISYQWTVSIIKGWK